MFSGPMEPDTKLCPVGLFASESRAVTRVSVKSARYLQFTGPDRAIRDGKGFIAKWIMVLSIVL